ncbi:serine/threonine protein kinase [Planctomycetes bacterium K23_9]|uniref:Serine/threonine-protein kinase StkP n=1 Tax=Stieleria marina TaxID=1930275 RepID=A0A517NRB0_9BACT|nr:Serine/threonine-protein kinase StkP [Planctomycetes bacterium K23_9]
MDQKTSGKDTSQSPRSVTRKDARQVRSSIREVHTHLDGEALGSIGRYDLLREIGRGGFGIVYLANDSQLQRQVAIKVARPEVVSDETGVERFQREFQAAAALDHDGIVRVFDCGNEDGLHYYVMSYLDCQNLDQWFSKQPKPLDERLAAQLVLSIAQAIQFGHDVGIVHRDLKPQNVLVRPSAISSIGIAPVVLDFGLCGLVDSGEISTSLMAGTPCYMAPEQSLFGNSRVSNRSDIYSLGAILYQLLTGTPPHQPASIAEAVLMHHGTPIVPPRNHRPDLSSQLQAICLKCLRKDAARRYASGKLLVDDLQNYLSGKPISARNAGILEKADFAIRLGGWESRLGRTVIAMNATNAIWTFVSTLLMRVRLADNPNIVAGFSEMLWFLAIFAAPLHLMGLYLGWVMTKRTKHVGRLATGAVISAIWAIYLWGVLWFGSEQSYMTIYHGQSVAQLMVFLLIATGYTIQSISLAIGSWAAKSRLS